jgi:glucose-1-phosphate adenylyltransferase
MVAEGCRLDHAVVNDSVIGLRSVLSKGSELHGVVLMGADYYEDGSAKMHNRKVNRPDLGIGPNTYIERAIIDKNARIGANVRIYSHADAPDGEDGLHVVRDGIVVIPKNTTVPAGTILGKPKPARTAPPVSPRQGSGHRFDLNIERALTNINA